MSFVKIKWEINSRYDEYSKEWVQHHVVLNLYLFLGIFQIIGEWLLTNETNNKSLDQILTIQSMEDWKCQKYETIYCICWYVIITSDRICDFSIMGQYLRCQKALYRMIK